MVNSESSEIFIKREDCVEINMNKTHFFDQLVQKAVKSLRGWDA